MSSGLQPDADINAAKLIRAAKDIRRTLADLDAGLLIPLGGLMQLFAEIRRISRVRSFVETSCRPREASDLEFAAAAAAYRSAMADWAQHLPRLQGWLLAEQHRLQTRLAHVRSVGIWADAQKRTR